MPELRIIDLSNNAPISVLGFSNARQSVLQPTVTAKQSDLLRADVFEGSKQVYKTSYRLGHLREYLLSADEFARRAAQLPGAALPNANNSPAPLPGSGGTIIPTPQPPEPNWGGPVGTKGGSAIMRVKPRNR